MCEVEQLQKLLHGKRIDSPPHKKLLFFRAVFYALTSSHYANNRCRLFFLCISRREPFHDLFSPSNKLSLSCTHSMREKRFVARLLSFFFNFFLSPKNICQKGNTTPHCFFLSFPIIKEFFWLRHTVANLL